jgi:predicted lipoprotein
LVTASIGLAGLASCWRVSGEDAAIIAARTALVQTWGEQVIVPWYQNLVVKAQGLEGASRALCASEDEPLAKAQAAWAEVRSQWKMTEVIAFGPYKEEPLRLGPKMDSWPMRENTVLSRLNNPEPMNQDLVDRLGASQVGLPVIEYLLFADRADLNASFASDTRRCAYLVATSARFRHEAQRLLDAWVVDGYLQEFLGKNPQSATFPTPKKAFGEVVNRIGFTLENMRYEKLSKPVGVRNGNPLPDSVESRYSGHSMKDLIDNLNGLELLIWGDDERGVDGLKDFLDASGQSALEPGLRQAFDRTRRALLDVPEPLAESVQAAPEKVFAAIDELKDTQRVIQVDLAPAIWVSVGFNDSDGD